MKEEFEFNYSSGDFREQYYLKLEICQEYKNDP